MIRRIFIAMAVTLILIGAVGARLVQAQQPASLPPKDAPPLGEAPSTTDDDPFGKKEAPKAKVPAPKLPKAPTEPEAESPRVSAPVSPVEDPKDKDDDLMRVQAPADGSNSPTAKEPAGGAPANLPPPGDPPILPPDRLPFGSSTGSLTVEVQGPANANLNRELKFKILVKNSGTAPVMGVIVRDPLDDKLDFVKSDPPCNQVGKLLTWQLDSLAAGAERALILTVIPRQVGDIDHAPTVSLRMGSKSRTMVKQPKLKVEVVHAEAGNVLKGRPVNLKVMVTNNGTGPARGVILHADLSSGLKHTEGTSLKVVFKDYLGKDTLGPGESEAIDLEVQAAAGGPQECKVWAESPDVELTDEAKGTAKVNVVEPKLAIKLIGPVERNTDAIASYTLTVSNEGTATARNVVAAAFLPPIGGQLINDFTPSEALWGREEKKLWLRVGDLDAGAKKELKFNIQLKGPGLFRIDAATQADSPPRLKDTVTTQVVGMADISCVITARARILTIGDEVTYEVKVSNTGTQEAKDVLVKAVVSEHLRIEETTGTNGEAQASSKDHLDAIFPLFSLPPKATQTLTLKVKATKAGVAKAMVSVIHGEITTENSTTTKVNEPK